MEKSQKSTLKYLLVVFLIISAIWFYLELIDCKFPMEPIVVFIGGIATLFASFWPWRPTYSDRRLIGHESFNYMSNNHKFDIGKNDLLFTLQFSKASDTGIHMYSDPPNIDSIALANGCGRIADIQDAAALNYSTRSVTPEEGEVVCLKNNNGHYAAIIIHDVKDARRTDAYDEVTFSYVINPDKKTNFS